MKSAKSLEILYGIVFKIKGPIEAKSFLSDVIFNVIDELQEEGSEISEQSIEKKLSEVTREYIEVSKNQNNVA